MIKGKKVKAIQAPSFDESLTTASIGLFLSRHEEHNRA